MAIDRPDKHTMKALSWNVESDRRTTRGIQSNKRPVGHIAHISNGSTFEFWVDIFVGHDKKRNGVDFQRKWLDNDEI